MKRASKLLPAFALLCLSSATQAWGWGQPAVSSPFDFGAVPAGSSVTHTITFNFNRATTISTVAVVTQGVTGKDFQSQSDDSNSTGCAGHTFNSGDTCTVDVTFDPLAPGLRIGEVQLLNGNGKSIVTGYISGWGLGAMLVSGTPLISTVAGIDNTPGYNYDPDSNNISTSNQLNAPRGVVTDLDGNIYIADSKNRIIRQVTPAGAISTVAGVQGQSPSGCQALVDAPALTTPAFDQPGGGMAIDAAGNLIVGDYRLHCVYRVNLKAETITTILGQGGSDDEVSDVPGPAKEVELPRVGGVGIDGAGDIYVGTSGYLLKIDPSNCVTAVAGNGIAGPFSGEGGPATSATISNPYTIIFNAAGELVFTDYANSRVLKIDASGDIHTILGGGAASTSSLPAFGSPGSIQATGVNTGRLWGVAMDGPGTLYATATEYGQIIALDPNGYAYLYSGTAAGTPFGTSADSGDGGAPGDATLSSPTDVWIAANGDMLVTDEDGDDVRRIGYAALSQTPLSFAATAVGHKSSDSPQSAILTNIGTAPLTYVTPAQGTNPTISSSFSVNQASTCQQPSPAPTFALGMGASCTYAVDFMPLTMGPLSGALTISGNVFGGTASIALSGIGIGQIQPVIRWASPSPITYGTTLAGLLNATALNGINVIPGNYVYSAGSSSVTASTVLPAGTYTLNVSFTPADTTIYKSATESVSLTVSKAVPGVSLASSANPVLLKNPTTFTATVSSSISIPNGTVTFVDGTTPIGTGSVVNGVASLVVSSLATGPHSIVATYSGDGNFLAGSSSAISQHIDDFGITAGGSTSHTILPGSHTTYQFTLTPMGDATFPANISLNMDGQPTNAVITFSPSGIEAGSGTINFTVTVATSNLAGVVHPATSFSKGAGPLLLGLLLLPFSRRLRRSARKLGRIAAMLLLLIAAGAALLGTTGCGSRTGFFATPQHTYTLSVTGASGALSHSTSVTLTVE